MDDCALLKAMFEAAVRAADPAHTLGKHLPDPPRGRTIVVGGGKAGGSMARALADAWDGPLEGLVVTRYEHGANAGPIRVVEASHPVPDDAGQAAAREMLELVSGLSEEDLVIALVSGGASALLSVPADGITLAEKQAINRALLKSGAAIDQMNAVRKHLSGIKGGRLAARCYPARVVTLAISDVPGDDPDVIGSGPTVPDRSTRQDALEILERYKIDVPASVRAALKRAFREDGGIKALFSTERVERTSVARRLRETSAAEARATVKEMMDLSGVELIGTRTLDEIVTRLVEQAKDGDIADVPEEAQAILLALTELDVPALEAAAALTQLMGQAQLSSVGHQIEHLAERITAMTAIAPGVLDHARFSTSFGRRFTYYDGFVFEIGPPADPYQRAFGAGGRYDRLLDRLSDGQVKATAIGAVIRPDRIAALGRS